MLSGSASELERELQWADSCSIELLRRPPPGVLMALALCPRQQSERLSGTLERAHRHGALRRRALGGLSRDEAGRLRGGEFDAAAEAAASAAEAAPAGVPIAAVLADRAADELATALATFEACDGPRRAGAEREERELA